MMGAQTRSARPKSSKHGSWARKFTQRVKRKSPQDKNRKRGFAELPNEIREAQQVAENAKSGLHRVLGRADLVLLFVVAIFNLNVVPSIVANGGVTVWLWLCVLLCFFWPQGIAVIELAERFPGEGGVYLWAK